MLLLRCSLAIGALTAVLTTADASESALGGHLLWGSCSLDEVKGVRDGADAPWPLLCLKADASSNVLLKQDADSSNIVFNRASLYGGLHLWRLISVHAEGEMERTIDLKYSDVTYPTNLYTSSAFVQLGNQALHHVQLRAGKMDLPFGVDFSPLPKVFDEWLKNDAYWSGPDYVTMFTWDNQREILFNVGWASSEIPEKDKPSERAVVARFAYDISAMDGTRLVVSGYGSHSGERRIGAAIVSIAASGEGGVFEWVRVRPQTARTDEPEPQIFRLGYQGPFYRKTRWLFEYEDSAREYRLVTLGHDFRLYDMAMFRMAAAYNGAIPKDGDRYWLVTMGLRLQI